MKSRSARGRRKTHLRELLAQVACKRARAARQDGIVVVVVDFPPVQSQSERNVAEHELLETGILEIVLGPEIAGRANAVGVHRQLFKTEYSRHSADAQLDDFDPFEVGDIRDDLDPRRAVTDDGNLLALQIDVGIPSRRMPLQSAKVVTAWYVGCDWAVEGARGGDQDVGFDFERFARFDPPEGDRVGLGKAVPARADELDLEDEAVSEAVFRNNPFPVWGREHGEDPGQFVRGPVHVAPSSASNFEEAESTDCEGATKRHVHARTSSRPAQCEEKSGFK